MLQCQRLAAHTGLAARWQYYLGVTSRVWGFRLQLRFIVEGTIHQVGPCDILMFSLLWFRIIFRNILSEGFKGRSSSLGQVRGGYESSSRNSPLSAALGAFVSPGWLAVCPDTDPRMHYCCPRCGLHKAGFAHMTYYCPSLHPKPLGPDFFFGSSGLAGLLGA